MNISFSQKKLFMASFFVFLFAHPKNCLADNEPPIDNKKILHTCAIYFIPETIDYKNTGELIESFSNMTQAGCNRIVINISTKGGSVEATVAAYNAIKAWSTEIITVNIGAVQSAGNILFCAGEKRYAIQNSYFMMHQSTYTFKSQHHNIISYMETSRAALRNIYAACFNKKITDINLNGSDTYFSASEAAKNKITNSTDALSYTPIIIKVIN